VELFAVLHDVKRENETWDPEHGERAAEFAEWLRKASHVDLCDADFLLLAEALRDHSAGHLDADLIVQICWDADRLDLGRVDVTPNPVRLCTDAARNPDYIQRAVLWAKYGRLQGKS